MRWSVLSLILLMTSTAASGAVTAAASASRGTSSEIAVAPLAVFFTADDSTSTVSGVDSFIGLTYEWDFGDPEAGSWSLSAHSKNQAIGPVAAHVFEKPGSYTVTVTVWDGEGGEETASLVVEVDDPDVVFAGDRTICYRQDTSGDFAGCPGGCSGSGGTSTCLTEGSWSSITERAAAGQRILLRCGDTWTSSTGSSFDEQRGQERGLDGPGMIGAFGIGEKPTIEVDSGPVLDIGATSDWRFVDLRFRGGGDGDGLNSENRGDYNRILIHRVEIDDFYRGIELGESRLSYYVFDGTIPSDTPMNDQLFIVDARIDNNGSWCIYASATRMAILGVECGSTSQGSHDIRTPYIGRGVIQHNRLWSAAGIAHAMKIHGIEWYGDNPFRGSVQGPTERIVISDNEVIGRGNDWNVSIGPQSASPGSEGDRNEHIERVIVERNFFRAISGTQRQVILQSSHSAFRNNIGDMSAHGFFEGLVWVHALNPAAPRASNNVITNNTCYVSDAAGSTVHCITVEDTAENTTVANNLLFAGNAAGRVVLESNDDEAVASNNITETVFPFRDTAPGRAIDFQIDESSEAAQRIVDQGTAMSSNPFDYGRFRRPADGDGSSTGEWDIGAWENVGQSETIGACGDSSTDRGELCDDGEVSTAACDSDCTFPECGDDLLNRAAGEECEQSTDCGDGFLCEACSCSETAPTEPDPDPDPDTGRLPGGVGAVGCSSGVGGNGWPLIGLVALLFWWRRPLAF